jgi:3-oxoacyl-[acyl-carrier protein] reductase
VARSKPKGFPGAAVVSGITGDVGIAVVRLLWDRGLRVLGFYGRSHTRARKLHGEAEARGAWLRLESVDLREPKTARRRIARIVNHPSPEWKRVDTFIGLAGFPAEGVWREPFAKHRAELFEDIYRVDTLSHVWFAQALAPVLKRRRGSVVLMGSAAGLVGDDLGIPFALAKAANVALVKSLARILAPRVRVNGVAPGALETPWLDELTPAQRRQARKKALLDRFGEPAEIAEAIVDLALGPCRFRSGQVLILDGGATL